MRLLVDRREIRQGIQGLRFARLESVPIFYQGKLSNWGNDPQLFSIEG